MRYPKLLFVNCSFFNTNKNLSSKKRRFNKILRVCQESLNKCHRKIKIRLILASLMMTKRSHVDNFKAVRAFLFYLLNKNTLNLGNDCRFLLHPSVRRARVIGQVWKRQKFEIFLNVFLFCREKWKAKVKFICIAIARKFHHFSTLHHRPR